VVDALKSMPEFHRFLRGMVAWVGFKTVILPYTPAKRIGGSTKYSFRKMLILATNAIFQFFLCPCDCSHCCRYFLPYLCARRWYHWNSSFRFHYDMAATPCFLILLCTGVTLVFTGTIGIYIGLIFQQVKQRPTYIVRANSK